MRKLDRMKSSDMVRRLCEESNISISELARRIGQSPQNLSKKLKRDTLTTDEMIEIANALDVKFEQAFTLEDGARIEITN